MKLRDQRGGRWLANLIQDLRHGCRVLRRSPGFTAIAVLSLALGIGAGTAIFSLINAILLSSLPVPNPQELRVINWYGANEMATRRMGGMSTGGPGGQAKWDCFSRPAFLALRQQCAAQADIFAYVPLRGITARAQREAVAAEGCLVSDNFFSGLGVRPVIGDLIGDASERGTGDTAAVISYSWWERQFALDPGVLGRPIVLNGHSFTIVGVLPRGFRGLRPGVGDAQFQAAMDGALKGATESFEKLPPKSLVADGSGGMDGNRSDYQKNLLLLLGVVGVVLLVACANLAGLLLARGVARQHEFSVRIALGAGRGRLVRQLLTESILLSAIGGGLGTLLALWGRMVLSRLLAGSANGLHYDTALDLRVLGFAAAVSLVSALLSGLLPSLRAGRIDPLAGLKDRAASGAGSRLRAGQFLVAAQVALSLLLMVGAGLYVRTLINLVRIDPGFTVEHLLLFRLNPANAGYKEPRTTAYDETVQRALAAIPGVRSATLLELPLLANSTNSSAFTLLDHPSPDGRALPAGTMTVSETFFTTMGIPLLLGRELKATDTSAALKVAVVNETFVRKYLPEEIPIGQTIKDPDGVAWQIVGVCRDTKYQNIKRDIPAVVYFSFRQNPTGSAYFALRTGLPPLAVAAAARKAVAAIDPNIPVTDLSTQEQARDKTISSERTFAALCSALAVLAVLLSCIGLYGLMAYDVARRIREMGIRQALGATRGQIAAPILRRAVLLAGTGVVVGVPLTLVLTQIIHANLYGLKPSDPSTLGGAVVLLLAVALIAAWIPARRAARVDPMVALRAD